ncbi:LamG-like jellyroll fold domain-containing protein [Lentzea rhizosphaerae]|uniref:LamG-like jellyroll fold domain-containing protein n=1 Tax=Lentzea rhizosphaerae TaxID=2041025 RepID=A0ABV8C358_9PSEU
MRRRPARAFCMRAFALVLAVSAGSITPVANAAPAPNELPDGASALAAARKFDKPVKVSGLTTEASETVANPNGTMTFVQTLRPERAKRGGKWVPVDTNLRKHADGLIRSEATLVDLTLAGKGMGTPLAVVAKDGFEVGLSWPEALPEPTVEGATTKYSEVWPGVDLKVVASATGFSQVLVVKTSEAAKSEKLRKITYGSHVKGGVLSQVNGSLQVKDDKGRIRFTGDASQMWDATGRPAKMGVEITGDTISVLPDQAFLASPETKFPVSIDPSYRWAGYKNHHAVAQELAPDAPNYDRTDGELGDLKVGWHPATGFSVSYVEMDIAQMVGKKIHSAKLAMTVINSANCDLVEPTAAWHTGPIGPGTTWRTGPQWYTKQSTINKKNNAKYCPTDGLTEFDVLGQMRYQVDNGYTSMTVGLSSDNYAVNDKAWRRFDLNPVLRVEYNSYPLPASDRSLERGLLPCREGGAANLVYVPTRTPRMRAKLQDPDGGSLWSYFQLYKWVDRVPQRIAAYQNQDTPSGSYSEAEIQPDTITQDGHYFWTVGTGDGELETVAGGLGTSCEFIVDTVKPVAPQLSSVEYPSSQPGGGVGVTGTFELDSVKSASGDVAKFIYSFTSDGGDSLNKEMPANSDGRATIRWTPKTAGTQTLFVKTVDRAGNLSDLQRYEFIVLAGGHPVAHWPLDGTLTDTNGGNALTPGGNPNLAAAGYAGKGAGLNGTQDYFTGGAVVDTSKNFTLAAWAKVDSGDFGRAVLATADSSVFSSGLYYDQGAKRWTFGMTAAANKADLKVVRARDEAQIGVWTHLAGTYEATTKTLTLHVDGMKQGEVAGLESWQASQLLVGRNRWNGQDSSGFVGTIDEIKMYNRTLNDAEIKVLAKQAGIRAHYKIAEGVGTSTRDEVTGRNATFGGKTSWEQGGSYTSLLLNGPGADGDPQDLEAYVSTPSPGIRTDRSYTVSAWARLDLEAHEDKPRTIVSLVQDGASQLDLRYSGASKKWEFVMGGTTVETAYRAGLKKWVYLTAVHDTTNSEMRLYLNGVYITRAPFTGGSALTESTLEMGRLTPTTAVGAFWKGGIDDVRVYVGALSDEEILAQAVRS